MVQPASAVSGDLLLTLDNPAPEINDGFGVSVASTPDGNIIVGAAHDNANAVDAGSAYLFLTPVPPPQTIGERLLH